MVAAAGVIGAGLLAAVLLAAALLGHLAALAGLLGRLGQRLLPPPPRTEHLSVEQLSADLRRLADHLEQTRLVDQPAKWERLTAAAIAYDWVLLSACRTLEVPEPGEAPLRAVDRLQAEAALAVRGLDW